MTRHRALIVDDEPDIRELLEITLGRMGIDTLAAPDLSTARRHLASGQFDLCLTDLNLPDGHGVELVEHIARERPQLPVAVITAYGSMDTAISALKAGAFDFVQKPVDLEQLRSLVGAALRLQDSGPATRDMQTRMIGDSAVMARLREQIARLARSQAPVYISGESGSGKELAARLIHEQSPRAERPFVAVNCGAIPGELMESEFFGHTRGSFTGAVADKEGLFQTAQGGTLFLDEVADLPVAMQVKLLRAIQEKAVRPIGAGTEQPIDVRVLCATHKNLGREVAEGRFRQDLYYRLNVIELHMPSLRDRPEDIPELVEHLLARIARAYGVGVPELSEAALQALVQHSFPGNVRELENILERAVTMCDRNRIEAEDLRLEGQDGSVPVRAAAAASPLSPPAPAEAATAAQPSDAGPHLDDLPAGVSLEDYLERIERQLITEALEATHWNRTAAAKRLGITFRALRYRLKKLALE
ncbi:MAG: sigma-54-dependent Fis family transcriptional regulator [Pseudomonadales bacterium]|nr:sigma-54-dependent Fis family transcriptional regulator [Pseudomonadales bacterium]